MLKHSILHYGPVECRVQTSDKIRLVRQCIRVTLQKLRASKSKCTIITNTKLSIIYSVGFLVTPDITRKWEPKILIGKVEGVGLGKMVEP